MYHSRCVHTAEDRRMKTTDRGNTEGKAILTVSFGTSYHETREKTIGAIERSLAAAFPEYEVRRAFTSRRILEKLRARDALVIDSVEEAMERLIQDGIRTVLVQPTHIIGGLEYEKMADLVRSYQTSFSEFCVGKPLLSRDIDYDEAVYAVAEENRIFCSSQTAVVLMGHGTEHAANMCYERLEKRFAVLGYQNYILGTVESVPSLDHVRRRAKALGVRRLLLVPFLIVAGEHVLRDMAGETDSWKEKLQADGFEVECILRGLGEYGGIQKIWIRHAEEALQGLQD